MNGQPVAPWIGNAITAVATIVAVLISQFFAFRILGAQSDRQDAREKAARAEARIAERQQDREAALVDLITALFELQVLSGMFRHVVTNFSDFKNILGLEWVQASGDKRTEYIARIVAAADRYGVIPEGLGADNRMLGRVVEAIMNHLIVNHEEDPKAIVNLLVHFRFGVRLLLCCERGEDVDRAFAGMFCSNPVRWIRENDKPIPPGKAQL